MTTNIFSGFYSELFGTSEDDVELDHTEDAENGTPAPTLSSNNVLAANEIISW